MTMRAIGLTLFEPFPKGMMTLDPLKLRGSPVTLQAVMVIKASPETDREIVGLQCVFYKVAEAIDLCFNRAIEPVIFMASKTLS